MSPPRILLIRHGEKPSNELPGLSTQGTARAKGLPSVFGSKSKYNISHIFAQKPHEKGKRGRPLQTVEPLAESLKLEVDVRREREDVQELAADLKKCTKGKGDVLVCWEHKRLHDIMLAMGVKKPPQYDSERYDLLWELKEPYEDLEVAVYSFEKD